MLNQSHGQFQKERIRMFAVAGQGTPAICRICQENNRMTRSRLWLLRELGSMPHRENPNGFPLYPVETTIRRNDHFSISDLWKFWYHSARFRKLLQSAQDLSGSPAKSKRCFRIVPAYVRQCREEMDSCRRRKAYLHEDSLARSASASARRESKS